MFLVEKDSESMSSPDVDKKDEETTNGNNQMDVDETNTATATAVTDDSTVTSALRVCQWFFVRLKTRRSFSHHRKLSASIGVSLRHRSRCTTVVVS